MTWVRIDDGFPEHPKILGLSDAAFRLHLHALCYSAKHLTDGYLPKVWLTGGRGRKVPKAVTQLIQAGLWLDAEGGYQVHDYLKYQPSREQVEIKRAQIADRVKRFRDKPVTHRVTPLPTRISASVVTLPPSHPIPSHPLDGSKNDPSETRADGFQEFWQRYPNKVGKLAAHRVWSKLKPNAELRTEILAAVERQKQSQQWLKDGGQFIPHPSTWLHQGRWLDQGPQDLIVDELEKFRPKGA